MKTYFAWVDENEVFNSKIHLREDESIFHLDISQKEGGYAQAKILLQNKGIGLLSRTRKRYCHISFDQDHIFHGRLVGMPSHISGELMALIFTACPGDEKEQAEIMKHQIMDRNGFCRLFYKGREKDISLSQALESLTALPHWCRISGKLSLSDLFKGHETIELDGEHFYSSLQTNVTQDPLSAIEVEVNCSWLQRSQGSCELSEMIKEKLPKGYLSSLTSKSLENSWWKKGDRLNDTAYHVDEASLSIINPPKDENQTKPIWHFDEKPKQVRFAKHWYDLCLRVGWQYRQQRKETAKFCLEQTVQDISGSGRRVKKLSFHLPQILGRNHTWKAQHRYTKGFKVLFEGDVYKCLYTHVSSQAFHQNYWKRLDAYAHVDGQSGRPTFFCTDKGKQAIGHAMEIAKAYLAASSRCIQVRIKGSLGNLKQITLDHSLVIKDHRLPGGSVEGKVISYKFILDGKTGEKIAFVTLGVSVGTGSVVHKNTYREELYTSGEYIEDDNLHGRSSSDLRFQIPGDQYPKAGLVRTNRLSGKDIVQSISIVNSAESQERILSQNQYPASMDMEALLGNYSTDIKIKLLDLNSTELMEHIVHVDVLTMWSSPKQIDLEAQ